MIDESLQVLSARYRWLVELYQRRGDEWRYDANGCGVDPTPMVAEHHWKALRLEVRARSLEGVMSLDVATVALRMSRGWQCTVDQLVAISERFAE